jgi:hypothetical protein
MVRRVVSVGGQLGRIDDALLRSIRRGALGFATAALVVVVVVVVVARAVSASSTTTAQPSRSSGRRSRRNAHVSAPLLYMETNVPQGGSLMDWGCRYHTNVYAVLRFLFLLRFMESTQDFNRDTLYTHTQWGNLPVGNGPLGDHRISLSVDRASTQLVITCFQLLIRCTSLYRAYQALGSYRRADVHCSTSSSTNKVQVRDQWCAFTHVSTAPLSAS